MNKMSETVLSISGEIEIYNCGYFVSGKIQRQSIGKIYSYVHVEQS